MVQEPAEQIVCYHSYSIGLSGVIDSEAHSSEARALSPEGEGAMANKIKKSRLFFC